jgi:hypothetical protein
MPDLPLPLQQFVTVQNDTTGQVNYLNFHGNTLVGSSLKDYGLGSPWKVVGSSFLNADGFPDLVAQNANTGQVDFLFLDANANLIGSALGSVGMPHIVGNGLDFGTVPGQVGNTMVSQLPNGQLDFLAFNASAQLISSQLLPNVGLPQAVGVAAGSASPQTFAGFPAQDVVVTQLADGSVDFLGFSGSFSNKTLAFVASFLVPGSGGTPPIGAVNQDRDNNFNDSNAGLNPTEAIHPISQLANGQLDAVFFDSGINDAAHRGTLYASTLFNLSLPGWHAVDGADVAHNLFPIV